MELAFAGDVIEWCGPPPYVFVVVPLAEAAEIAAVAGLVTYGWGCIPVTARVGATTFTTSLFPNDGGYLLPVKAAVRRAEGVEVGDVVRVRLRLAGRP
jgi:hypothetical protein